MPTPPIQVYVWTYCPYCRNAISLLKSKSVPFEEIVLDGKDQELQELRSRTGMRTVPQIFIDGKLIGGYSELSALDQQGKLDPMLGLK